MLDISHDEKEFRISGILVDPCVVKVGDGERSFPFLFELLLQGEKDRVVILLVLVQEMLIPSRHVLRKQI